MTVPRRGRFGPRRASPGSTTWPKAATSWHVGICELRFAKHNIPKQKTPEQVPRGCGDWVRELAPGGAIGLGGAHSLRGGNGDRRMADRGHIEAVDHAGGNVNGRPVRRKPHRPAFASRGRPV